MLTSTSPHPAPSPCTPCLTPSPRPLLLPLSIGCGSVHGFAPRHPQLAPAGVPRVPWGASPGGTCPEQTGGSHPTKNTPSHGTPTPPVHPAPLWPVAPEGPSTWLRLQRCAGETLTFPASGTHRELSAAPRGSLKARRAAAVIALIYLLTAGAEGRGMWHSLPLWEPYGTHLSPFAAAGQGGAAAPVNALLTVNFSHHLLLQEGWGHGTGGLGRGPGRDPQGTAPTGHSTHLPFPTHSPSWQRYSSTQCPRPSPHGTGQGAAGM